VSSYKITYKHNNLEVAPDTNYRDLQWNKTGYLNITPNWEETLQTAIQSGLTSADVNQLFEVLQIKMPESLVVP